MSNFGSSLEPTEPPPPPFVPRPLPSPTATSHTGQGPLGHPLALFVVCFGIGLAAAIALGSVAGALSYSTLAADCSPSDGWCELGAALLAVVAGLLVGLVAYLAAGVLAIVRWREHGRRWQPILAHVATPFGLALLWAIASGLGL